MDLFTPHSFAYYERKDGKTKIFVSCIVFLPPFYTLELVQDPEFKDDDPELHRGSERKIKHLKIDFKAKRSVFAIPLFMQNFELELPVERMNYIDEFNHLFIHIDVDPNEYESGDVGARVYKTKKCGTHKAMDFTPEIEG